MTVTSRSSPRLAVVEQHVARELRLRLARVDDVDDERIELVVAKDVDALLEARRIVEIADEHGEAAALVLRDERLHARRRDRSDAGGLERAQEAEHLEDAPLAARLGHAVHDLVAGRDDGDAIEVGQAHVGERRARRLACLSFAPSPKAIEPDASTMK